MIIRNLLTTMLTAILLMYSGNAFAKIIYVDKGAPESGSGWDGSDGHNYGGVLGSGTGYSSIQVAINSMQPGDHIILRGDSYTGCITIPTSKNPTNGSWTEGNYNKIASYPGEWAVLDGKRNCSDGVVIGNRGWAEHWIKYWMLERLEITGGGGETISCAAGFWGEGGPFWIRYCYIHDNYDEGPTNNPGGITGHRWQDSIIEYNYIKNNGILTGSHHNGGNINLYSDYVENPQNVDIQAAMARNVIRYNLIEGSQIGIKYKNSQWLSLDHSGQHMTYKEYGDKIHHNIIRGTSNSPIDARQDFIQIHNNIFESIDSIRNVTIGEAYSADREPFLACIYNNYFIRTRLSVYHNPSDGDGSSYDLGQTYSLLHPNVFILNNLFRDISYESDGHNDLNILFTYSGWDIENVDMNTVHIENNLFYNKSRTDKIVNVGDNDTDLSINELELSNYSIKNYCSVTSGLTSSGSDYIVNYDYIIDESTGKTISNGGIGGLHPYLTTAIPKFVGATNSSNNEWVGVVLSLSSTNTLRSGGTASTRISPDNLKLGSSQ